MTVSEPETYSFERFLEAKRTVDDRAINRRVRRRLREELDDRTSIHVVELGAGTGAMLDRLLSWGVLTTAASYRAIDVDRRLLQQARQLVLDRPQVNDPVRTDDLDPLTVDAADGSLKVTFTQADALDWLPSDGGTYDLVVAHAFLDLTHLPAALEAIVPSIAPGGYLYAPVTFDGSTKFWPPMDSPCDDRIERQYHRRMDHESGDSRAGRRLLGEVPRHGGRVLAAGGADWIVRPVQGTYPSDEAYFLHHLIDLIRRTLEDDEELGAEALDGWVDARHRQIHQGELELVAHHLDILARFP